MGVIPDLIRNPAFSLWARFHPRGGSTPEGGPLGPEAIWILSGPGALWAGGPLEFTPYLIRGGNDGSQIIGKPLLRHHTRNPTSPLFYL